MLARVVSGLALLIALAGTGLRANVPTGDDTKGPKGPKGPNSLGCWAQQVVNQTNERRLVDVSHGEFGRLVFQPCPDCGHPVPRVYQVGHSPTALDLMRGSHFNEFTSAADCTNATDCTSYVGGCSSTAHCTDIGTCSSNAQCTNVAGCSSGGQCTIGASCSSGSFCTKYSVCSSGGTCTRLGGALCSSGGHCTEGTDCHTDEANCLTQLPSCPGPGGPGGGNASLPGVGIAAMGLIGLAFLPLRRRQSSLLST